MKMEQQENFLAMQSTGNKIANRLMDYIRYINSNRSAFERSCNISNGYLSKLLIKGNSIGSQILIRIKCRYPNLNINWIITGEGNMIVDENLK
jgi:hypothetical protein